MNSKKIVAGFASGTLIGAFALGSAFIAYAETEGAQKPESGKPTNSRPNLMMNRDVRGGGAYMGSSSIRMMGSSTRGFSGKTGRLIQEGDFRGRMGSTSNMMGSTTRRDGQVERRMENGANIADREIENRTNKLNELISRIDSMKNLTDAQKAEYKTVITSQISKLTDLGAKIKTDTSTSSLKDDLKSITQGNRIYALVMPKTEILAAVDRVNTIATSFTTLSGKLQIRIDAAQASGTDVTALRVKITDLNTILADIKTKIQSVQAGVANLLPDNGDQTVLAANNAALKTARDTLKKVQEDIKKANDDAMFIVRKLNGNKHPNQPASTTATTTDR